MIGDAVRGAKMWDAGSVRKIERWCADVGCTTAERVEAFAHFRAQYIADREAYLATLPDTSRMGRLIWLHARRQAAQRSSTGRAANSGS